MAIGDVAGSVGRGLLAGLFGTGVMTLVQTVEMKLADREGSSAPADAVEKVLDIVPRTEDAAQRLSQLSHFAYGTSWGGVRGLLGGIGLRGMVATPLHLGLVWGAAAIMLPKLEIAPPVTEWGAKGIANDLLHHGIYAFATGLAYDWLERHSNGRGALG